MRKDLPVAVAVGLASALGCASRPAIVIGEWRGTFERNARFALSQTDPPGTGLLLSATTDVLRERETLELLEIFVQLECPEAGLPKEQHPTRASVARYRRTPGFSNIRRLSVTKSFASCERLRSGLIELSLKLELADPETQFVVVESIRLAPGGAAFEIPIDERPPNYPWPGSPDAGLQ